MHVDVSTPAVGPRSAPPESAPKVRNIALWLTQVLLVLAPVLKRWTHGAEDNASPDPLAPPPLEGGRAGVPGKAATMDPS